MNSALTQIADGEESKGSRNQLAREETWIKLNILENETVQIDNQNPSGIEFANTTSE